MHSSEHPIARKLWEVMGLQPGFATWFAIWQFTRSAGKPKEKKPGEKR